MKEQTTKQQANDERPDLPKLRPGLFWDTDINEIDWIRERRAVIERIIERGDENEQQEIKRFYGEAVFDRIAHRLKEQASQTLRRPGPKT